VIRRKAVLGASAYDYRDLGFFQSARSRPIDRYPRAIATE